MTKVGKGTKRMVVTDGNGTLLGVVLARASRAQIRLARETMDAVCVPRPRGRPRKRPERLIADRRYDCDDFQGWVRRRG